MRVKLNHIFKQSSLEDVIRLRCFVNQIYHIFYKIGVICCCLLIKLLHLDSNLLLLLLKMLNFLLSLLENLIDLSSTLFSKIFPFLRLLHSFYNCTWSINSTLHCTLNKACNSANWFCYDTKQATTKAFGYTRKSVFHSTLNRLSNNTGDTLKCSFYNCISSKS